MRQDVWRRVVLAGMRQDVWRSVVLAGRRPFTENHLTPAHLPRFSASSRIFFTRSSHTAKVARFAALEAKMRHTEIKKDGIASAPGKYILKDTWDMRHSFASVAAQGEKPVLIYSLWDGYLKRDQQFWDGNKIEIIKIHTSGHAYRDGLLQLVRAMKPKKIVPIHTAHKEMYQELFKDFKVEPHNPGEEFKA